MSDEIPPTELLENLDLLMSMDELENESDWDVVTDPTASEEEPTEAQPEGES